ncbi:MAG: PorP/SprF family type IX secretion system membrane protein [Bacteroidota bacterium]|nr:PorP/SprF family type IX secretion system membrane protein [Bacteroidota bacterium]
MKSKVLYLAVIFNLASCILHLASSFAQDIHFSQTNMTPLLVNPALTGFMGNNHRAILNYKSQWIGMGASGATYRTGSFSYDTRLLTRKFKTGYIGAGINAFKDVAGDLKLGTTQLNISFAGIVIINKKQSISGGIQGGYVQKSISTADMKWDSQYDEGAGVFNPQLSSNDVVSIPPYRYGDFSGGLAWNYSSKQTYMSANNQLKVNLGIAAFHINRPSQKLNPYNTNSTDDLYSKFIAHGSAVIGIASTNYEFQPSAILFKQGGAFELNMGAMIRCKIRGESRYTGNVEAMAVSIGAQYRIGDAFIPMMMFEYSNYALGVSYDVNTSMLKQSTGSKGGLEISLRYTTPDISNRSSSRLLK